MTCGLVALPINDIPFEEQRPYPGSVQDNCKHIHRSQFHSADTLEPARRTPDDPVPAYRQSETDRGVPACNLPEYGRDTAVVPQTVYR